MFAATFGSGQVAFSILWFFLFLVEIWLAISIFIDIFRSHDLKGWVKASWIVLVLVLPIVGILAYLIFRGDEMRAHQVAASREQQQAARTYFQHLAGGGHSPADEIAKLAELKRNGVLSDEEFDRLKSRVIDESTRAH